MDFDFSPDERELQAQVRRYLADQAGRPVLRAVLDGTEPHARALWRGLGAQGYLGAAIPERWGGAEAGHGALCLLAEELGRVLAPLPFLASIGLCAEALLLAGSDAQRSRWLPRLARGEAIGTLGWVGGPGRADARAPALRLRDGRLHGTLAPVLAGAEADVAVVLCQDADAADRSRLALVDLAQPGVQRRPLASIDPTLAQAALAFDGVPAEALDAGPASAHGDAATAGAGGETPALQAVLDRAAVLCAFQQLGGADQALETACAYAQQRFAFGRPIGGLQAIKHRLADLYVSATLARSNAYFGAWALQTGAPELAEAAATARVSATQAYQHCARENTQVHGGMGFTWELDCHLHQRRAQALALALGGPRQWEDRLVHTLRLRRAADAQAGAHPATPAARAPANA